MDVHLFIIDRDIFLSTLTHKLKLKSWMNELSYLIYIFIKLLLKTNLKHNLNHQILLTYLSRTDFSKWPLTYQFTKYR